MSRYLIPGFLIAAVLVICVAGAFMQETAVPSMTMQNAGSYSPGAFSPGSDLTGIPPAGNLTSAEIEELLAQQDAEKFQRDAYRTLDATYLSLPIFTVMADTADSLLNYGNRLLPKSSSLEPAVYEHGDLGQLFHSYIGSAGPDPSDGLTAAAMTEDMHISGLMHAMSQTTNPYLRDLYHRELLVARNNLRIIAHRLETEGISYSPQYIDGQTFAAIIKTPAEAVTIPPRQAGMATYAPVGLYPDAEAVQGAFAELPSGDLNETEIRDVLFLQDEEKFERDLYMTLAAENPDLALPGTLAQAADTEMNADDVILQRYNITYTPLDPGTFSHPNLQYVYNEIVGNISVLPTDILGAAAEGEDLHIADLTAALKRTNNADIQYIYNNQLALARNSMREITQELRARGGTYSPQFISPDYYNTIIGSPIEMTGS